MCAVIGRGAIKFHRKLYTFTVLELVSVDSWKQAFFDTGGKYLSGLINIESANITKDIYPFSVWPSLIQHCRFH